MNAALLRAMARWFKKRGYGPGSTRCFVAAAEQEWPRMFDTCLPMIVAGPRPRIRWYFDDELVARGWTTGCTDDAIAACLIAADIEECNERASKRKAG